MAFRGVRILMAHTAREPLSGGSQTLGVVSAFFQLRSVPVHPVDIDHQYGKQDQTGKNYRTEKLNWKYLLPVDWPGL